METTARAVDQINAMRNNMDQAVNSMAQIDEATREQSTSVAGIAGSAEKISIKTQSSASQVQETVTSLQQLQDRANDLLDVANRFKL